VVGKIDILCHCAYTAKWQGLNVNKASGSGMLCLHLGPAAMPATLQYMHNGKEYRSYRPLLPPTFDQIRLLYSL